MNIFTCAALPASAKLIYLYIKDSSGQLRTQQQMAEECGLARDTVSRALRTLEELGFICRIWRGRMRCYRYTVGKEVTEKPAPVNEMLPKAVSMDAEPVMGTEEMASPKITATAGSIEPSHPAAATGTNMEGKASEAREKTEPQATPEVKNVKERGASRRAQKQIWQLVSGRLKGISRPEGIPGDDLVNVGNMSCPELVPAREVAEVLQEVSEEELQGYLCRATVYQPKSLQYHLRSLWNLGRRLRKKKNRFNDFDQRNYSQEEWRQIEQWMLFKDRPKRELSQFETPLKIYAGDAMSENQTLKKYYYNTNKLNVVTESLLNLVSNDS